MNDPQTLQGLIDSAMGRRQVSSGRRLAELASEQGFAVSHATINLIRAGTHKSRPKAETIRAIAWLAGVPEAVAFIAAGLPVPGPPFADELPPGVDNLSPKARKAVIEMLRVLIDEGSGVVSEEPAVVTRQHEVALAAMAGTPAYAERDETGEETQETGSDEPA